MLVHGVVLQVDPRAVHLEGPQVVGDRAHQEEVTGDCLAA